MAFGDVSTGLRIGELLALQWQDIDFENFEISVTRSISLQHIGEALWSWRQNCDYPKPGDWVFASPAKDGKQPHWPGTLYRAHLEPAAKAAGIKGKIGWHTSVTPSPLCSRQMTRISRQCRSFCATQISRSR